MGFQEIADLDCSTTISLGGKDRKTGRANPTSIEGYFIGTRKVESNKAKDGYSSLHVFQTAEGNVGVWGKTNLNQKLAGVKPGVMTRATFVGMVETRNNPMYKYKVEVDAGNAVEVAGVEADAEYGSTQSFDEGSDDTDLFDSEPALDEPAPARPTAPAKSTKKALGADKLADLQSRLSGFRK